MSAANPADTVSAVEYRAATNSAATAHVASSAASGVNRSLRSERARPTSPMATRKPAMTAARLGWGPRRASIAYGKLARVLPLPRTQCTNVPTPRPSATLAYGPALRGEAAARRPEPRRRRVSSGGRRCLGGGAFRGWEEGLGGGARRRCAREGMDQRPPMNMSRRLLPCTDFGGAWGEPTTARRMDVWSKRLAFAGRSVENTLMKA